AAIYTVASTPPTLPIGNVVSVAVSITNTGTATWNSSGANLVDLSYHWYDTTGKAVVWDGLRSPLSANVPPTGTIAATAQVVPPTAAGTYLLRFALVKEGVGWFDPEAAAHTVAVVSPFQVSFGQVTPPASFVAGGTYTIAVPVTNFGTSIWNATGANPIQLSYHWFDASGTKVVNWDGVRTLLPTNVDPGANTTLQMAVVMPKLPGSYLLQVDLVREGMAWFSTLGSAPASVSFMVITGLGAS